LERGAQGVAGKSARRFTAASPVSVIRVDPHYHRRICAPDICRPSASLLAGAASTARVRAETNFPPRGSGPVGQPVPVRRDRKRDRSRPGLKTRATTINWSLRLGRGALDRALVLA
jgi:hypothetical protein